MDNHEHHANKKVERCDEASDRLSNLPDPLIYHILSFMDTRYAVQTSALSKKWRHYWAHIDGLNLDSRTFNDWMDFRKFVIRVFRYRNHINLRRLRYHGRATLLDRVLSYAKSQSLEELELTGFLLDTLPSSFSECEALRKFKFGPCSLEKVPDSFPFASLKTLELSRVGSLMPVHKPTCDLFSGCLNLENLIIVDSSLVFCRTFIISTPRLINLVISNLDFHRHGEKPNLVVSAPSLESFEFDGTCLVMFSMEKCSTLERVTVHIRSYTSWEEIDDWKEEQIKDLISIAEELSHAKSLNMTVEFSKGIMKNKIKTCQGRFILQRRTHEGETEILEFKEEKLRELPTSFYGRSCGSAKDRRRLLKAHHAEFIRQKAELEHKLEEWKDQARRLKRMAQGEEGVFESEELRKQGEELGKQGEELLRELEALLPSSSSG